MAVRSWRGPVALALPLLVYLVPLGLGYAWSSLDPNTPNVPGLAGYQGRSPDEPISIDSLATGGLVVPQQARLRAYLRAGDLPLWNPDQGLGQPFAAQSDGGTYFPLTIVRSLLPYRLADYVTVLGIYLAGLATYRLILGLGASWVAAIFGGMGYQVSGALSLSLARPNVIDQLCMLAVLFWAAELALRRRTLGGYALLALAAGLYVIAGFVEIALLGALVLAGFMAVYAAGRPGAVGARLRNLCLGLGALSLGACLAAFDLLPLAEAIRLGANLRSDLAGFLPTPYGNGVAFVAPTTFGPLDPRTPSWVPGGPSNVVDWNAMNACLGISPAVLVTLGWAVQGATWGRRQRLGFRFFSVAGLFLLLRYLQVQPAAAINLLPLPDRQMPKYTVGVVAFCLLVAAALAVDHVRAEPGRRVRWWGLGLAGALAGSVLTLIGQRGGFAAIDGQLAGTYVPATLTIASAVLLGVALARRWPGLPPGRAGVLLIAVLVGELSVYVPLGSRAPELLWARVGLCGLVVLAGVLLAGRRRWGATGLLSAVVVSYGLLVALPTVGLPRQFDVDQPPAFMGWLRTATGDDYRSFGILPDFSSIDGIQDVGVAGPLAPDAFGAFVALVSDPQLAAQYQRTGTFWISSRFSGHASYSLGDYSRARAVLDWVGVRFLVLDRAVFQPGGRTDDQALLESNSGVIVAYEDHAVRILESPQARPKAEFWTGAEVYPDQATVLAQLRQFPDRILGAPILEATGAPSNAQLRNELHARASSARVAPVNVEEYRPNEVRLGVQSPDAGVVVLKDIYSPGWQAWVDGQPSPVLRVDGLVRGVAIAQAGQHEVRFRYQPESFVRGLWVAALTATLLLSSAVSAYLGYLRHGRCQP